MLNDAMQAAESAFASWRHVAPEGRASVAFKMAGILRRRKLELAAWMVYEVDKPWDEADGEVCEAIGIPPEWAQRCEDSAHLGHDGTQAALGERLERMLAAGYAQRFGTKVQQFGSYGGGNHFGEAEVVKVADSPSDRPTSASSRPSISCPDPISCDRPSVFASGMSLPSVRPGSATLSDTLKLLFPGHQIFTRSRSLRRLARNLARSFGVSGCWAACRAAGWVLFSTRKLSRWPKDGCKKL